MYISKQLKFLNKQLITLIGLNCRFNTKKNYVFATNTWVSRVCFAKRKRINIFFLLLLVRERQILYPLDYYKLLRLKQGLPVRGQRTHTNACTSFKLNKSKFKKQ